MVKLCEFSYKGDIRMRWKMENPNKVTNIVKGQIEGLSKIYRPLLEELQSEEIITLHELDDGVTIRFKSRNDEKLQQMFDRVPRNLKWQMKDSVKALSLREMQEDLEKHLAGIVDITSIYMILSGLYSTSPLKKGLPYLLDKFKKGRSK